MSVAGGDELRTVLGGHVLQLRGAPVERGHEDILRGLVVEEALELPKRGLDDEVRHEEPTRGGVLRLTDSFVHLARDEFEAR